MVIYVVQQGDTIYSISRKYGIPPQKIIRDNQLTNPSQLTVGQAIVIMAENTSHRVARGQTLSSLAKSYGTTAEKLLAVNAKSQIRQGQIISIPSSAPKTRTIYVNGYALPDITKYTLTSTLPYLTYISIFSYLVKPDGSLIPIPDVPIINTARQYSVAPMMVITNIKEGGSFDSELAHNILTNEEIQNVLIENVINVLEEKKYFGLDIDFEYIYPADRNAYNNFLRKVTDKLRPMGYTITTALAPKTSDTQSGLLYEAHDYQMHGQLADHVILMTYEWGYTYEHYRYMYDRNLILINKNHS